MTLNSMTGFGRASGQMDNVVWAWEIRTVNGRGLDIRMRLPPGFEEMETGLRETLGKAIKRGNCTANLTVRGAAGVSDIRLNEDVLRQVSDLASRAQEITGLTDPVPLADLIAMRGVIETADCAAAEALPKALRARLVESFSEALGELVGARHDEGQRLHAILQEKIQEIESETRQAEASPERRPDAIADRLRQ